MVLKIFGNEFFLWKNFLKFPKIFLWEFPTISQALQNISWFVIHKWFIQVQLPSDVTTLYICRMFKIDASNGTKKHIVKVSQEKLRSFQNLYFYAGLFYSSMNHTFNRDTKHFCITFCVRRNDFLFKTYSIRQYHTISYSIKQYHTVSYILLYSVIVYCMVVL